MMEDIGEQWTVSKEVSDAISKSFGYNVDEEELEKELEELEKENKDNLSVKLPSAPCAKPDRSAKKTGKLTLFILYSVLILNLLNFFKIKILAIFKNLVILKRVFNIFYIFIDSD